MNVHLVDGTYELFRNYFGAPARTGPGGREVGAALGLARTLIALVNQPDVTHIAVAYDHVIESFRNDLFDGYKTGEGIEPDLFAQFPLAEEVTRALGIVCWPMVDFEADDALATAAARFSRSKRVNRVILCSPDKDLTQCVRDERVVCLDRRREIVLDEAAVVKKFGVLPESIPDYLALVGDAADGIPGIPGWGAKSTATVLRRYGEIDRIPSDAAAWEVHVTGARRLSANLEVRLGDASLYRRLATLRTDVPIDEKLGDLEYRGASRERVEAVAGVLADGSFVDRIPAWRP